MQFETCSFREDSFSFFICKILQIISKSMNLAISFSVESIAKLLNLSCDRTPQVRFN